MDRIHIITTCTDRKSATPIEAHQLRSLSDDDSGSRCQRWCERLVGVEAPTRTASKLYSGEHWSVTLDLPSIARQRGFVPQLWVCSAGYGLIPVEAEVKPYAATFTHRHADSVGRKVSDARRWWRELALWKGPVDGAPRTILDLVEQNAEDTFLIAISAVYLNALSDDLDAAVKKASEGRLLLISAGASATALETIQLPVNSRLQGEVGGTRLALNARVARWLLERTSTPDQLDFENARLLLEGALKGQPPITRHERLVLDDEQVRTFIRSALERDPSIRHSPLLRHLRSENKACEQSRLRKIFEEVKEFQRRIEPQGP